MWSVLLLALVGSASATNGFDASDAVSTSAMSCMKKTGYSFFIARVYRSNGVIDQTGLQNIKNAWAGGMSHVDAYIFPCVPCGNPAGQVQSSVNALHNANAIFGMIWLDIEINNWPSNQTSNRGFIMSMANQLNALGINWGVYTNYNFWQSIVGASWTGLSNRPLWWTRFDGQPNYNNWSPFGGWSKPAIHQYAGDVASPCGFKTDKNWYP